MVRDLPSIQQGQTSLLFSFRHCATTLVDMPDFRARKTRRDFRIALEMKHIVGKTEQSLFKDASCSVDSFFFLTKGRLNRGRLFFVIDSETCTFWMTSRSLTYLSYCSCPSCSIWKTVSTTACSAMFLLSSTRRSLLFSVDGFPYSSIVLARQSTSRLKAFWTCFVSSHIQANDGRNLWGHGVPRWPYKFRPSFTYKNTRVVDPKHRSSTVSEVFPKIWTIGTWYLKI